ncbi:MAG: DUF3127 domain-containing protein [Bacteroidales bacterium]|nr:DUF3127 domain-containing protein [Bacteroidales bacterium]
MALDLTGKLLQKLPVQSGQSAKGAWSKQEFVIETQEGYSRKVCMSVWGVDKVNELSSFADGEVIKVSFNIESRPFNDRWYTDVRAWRIERSGGQEAATPQPFGPNPATFSDPGYLNVSNSTEVDDLPF